MDSEIDYFISYTTADRQKAEWIAWWLEEIGHKVIFDKWDFKPGESFPAKMDDAIRNARKILAILSNNYINNRSFASSEWSSAFSSGKLLAIQIETIEKNKLGLWSGIIPIDLTHSENKDEAISQLQQGIEASEDGVRSKPATEPADPFKKMPQPTSDINVSKADFIFREEDPGYKANLVDKDQQIEHIFKQISNQFKVNNDQQVRPLAFLLHGSLTHHPIALMDTLYYHIKNHHQCASSPEGKLIKYPLVGKISPESYESYLWNLLGIEFTCPHEKDKIELKLSAEKALNIYYRVLLGHEAQDHKLISKILDAWEDLKLTDNTPRHILVLFYEEEPNLLKKKLTKKKYGKRFLPDLEPITNELVNVWVNAHCNSSQTLDIRNKIKQKIKKGLEDNKIPPERYKKVDENNYEIHHYDLKGILKEILIESN